VVAPTSIVTTPTMVANMPLFLFCSASNTAFSASAAGAPTTPASCATIAEYHTRKGSDDNQQWSERKSAVKGQCRAHRRCAIIDPCHPRLPYELNVQAPAAAVSPRATTAGC
jgi:hypothetical protein